MLQIARMEGHTSCAWIDKLVIFLKWTDVCSRANVDRLSYHKGPTVCESDYCFSSDFIYFSTHASGDL